MPEKEAANFLPWNEKRAVNKTRWYELKPERAIDIPGLREVEAVNNRFASAADYRSYYLLKKLSHLDDDVVHELHKMAKKIASQIKDCFFSGKDPILVVAFLQDCKSACDAYGIYEGAVMCLFKYFLTGLSEPAVKAPTT